MLKVGPVWVLFFTPSFAPRAESCVRNIWLSPVTAEVWTVVETAFVEITIAGVLSYVSTRNALAVHYLQLNTLNALERHSESQAQAFSSEPPGRTYDGSNGLAALPDQTANGHL
jgi:hypothetical protein